MAVQQAREDIKRDKEEREEKLKRDKAKREREEAKREREEEEKEEKNRRDKAKREREIEEKEELAKELAKIERARTLAQARARSRREQQIDKDEHLKADATTRDSTGLLVPASKSKKKKKKKDTELPATKIYAAFISHKKAHSKYGDSSSTLSRSLKVRQMQFVFYGLLILFSLAGHVEMAEHKRVF